LIGLTITGEDLCPIACVGGLSWCVCQRSGSVAGSAGQGTLDAAPGNAQWTDVVQFGCADAGCAASFSIPSVQKRTICEIELWSRHRNCAARCPCGCAYVLALFRLGGYTAGDGCRAVAREARWPASAAPVLRCLVRNRAHGLRGRRCGFRNCRDHRRYATSLHVAVGMFAVTGALLTVRLWRITRRIGLPPVEPTP